MNARRLPLFCDTAMAQRIERAEAQLIAKASEAAQRRRAGDAGFVVPVAGGVASFAEAGSPYNKVAGLGFDGVPSAATLDEIERGCRPRCCQPGSPMPQPPAATSPPLPRCQDPSLSRTCSAKASICSTLAPPW